MIEHLIFFKNIDTLDFYSIYNIIGDSNKFQVLDNNTDGSGTISTTVKVILIMDYNRF